MSDDDEDSSVHKKTPRWPEVGRVLRVARNNMSISQDVIITRLPVWAPLIHPSTLSRYESGHHLPDIAMAAALARAYGIAVSELLKAVEQDASRRAMGLGARQ